MRKGKRGNKMKKIIGNLVSVKFAVVFSMCLGVFIGASGLALGQNLAQHDKIEKTEAKEVVMPEPKLPREWVWQRKALNFDHMYRKAR